MTRAWRATLLFPIAVVLFGACSATNGTEPADGVGGGQDGGGATSGSGGTSTGGAAGSGTGAVAGGGAGGTGGAAPNCGDGSTDLQGCVCSSPGSQACYPSSVNPATRKIGVCIDGTQECKGTPEFSTWTECVGAVTPNAENCQNGLDDDCNGLIDCVDPTCASDPACGGTCNDGETRPCYDGPAGTVNVGICKPGTQTCTGGNWPATCTGETLPEPAEGCSKDTLDHNCNGFKGCDDIFACLFDTTCWGACSTPDPGCVCPVGVSDDATCPSGYFGKTKSIGFGTGKPPEVECCPCTASNCAERGCCMLSACKSNAFCSGFTCTTLPASCNGKASFDCDFEDYDPSNSSNIPEDCDMPCCPCKPGC